MPEESTNIRTLEEKAHRLDNMDVIALIACWAGVTAVTYFSNDPVVAVVAIASAYYLAKWVILKKEKRART